MADNNSDEVECSFEDLGLDDRVLKVLQNNETLKFT